MYAYLQHGNLIIAAFGILVMLSLFTVSVVNYNMPSPYAAELTNCSIT